MRDYYGDMIPLPAELHSHKLTRRQLIRAGVIGSCSSLGLLQHTAIQAAAAHAMQPGAAKIRSCIFVFYYGGPSHLDTYDMKPNAPDSVRGEFKSIQSSLPGLQISEHMPNMARVMHKVALVRSMHHTNRLHDSASTETHTGRQSPQGDREEFSPIPQFYPCHGAVLSMLAGHQDVDVSHALLPYQFHNVVTTPCQGGGFLGHRYDPLLIDGNPAQLTYDIESLKRPADLADGRIRKRDNLLQELSAVRLPGDRLPFGELRDRAHELLQSESLRRALRIDEEPAAVREKYGMQAPSAQAGHGAAALESTRPLRGQNLLLARRLVESEVPFVNVHDFLQQGRNWDSHSQNFRQHKIYLLPQADQALAALIEDLDDRGLLESTLLVATGEFGRTPKINANAGRDHWPDCYTVLMAGGGVRPGMLYGSSDKTGAYPETDPVTPADLAATIYDRFGLNPHLEIRDRTGRPHRIADGSPIRQLFEG